MTNKQVEAVFSQLREFYKRIKSPSAKEYGLVLGTANEVYLMKGDGKKSVFLGRLGTTGGTEQDELKVFLVALRDHFEKVDGVAPTAEQEPIKEQVQNKKQVSTPTYVTEDAETPSIPEDVVTMDVSEVEDDDDFDAWADKLQ